MKIVFGMKNGAGKNWKDFEEGVRQASSKIFNPQTVTPNQKIKGSISQVLRQIDIKVGDTDFIDIECKDLSKPVDLPKVEQFANKLRDENAGGGIMVSNSGFTKAALKAAEHYKIKPFVLVDRGYAGISNFLIKVPVLARSYYVDSLSCEISGKGQDFRISPLIWDTKAWEGGPVSRNLYDIFKDHWNNGTIEISKEGAYKYTFKKVPIKDLREKIIVIDVSYQYLVKTDLRKGYAGVNKARGFFDVNTGTFTSSENLIFEPLEVNNISKWAKVTKDEELLKQPFRLEGRVLISDEPPLSVYRNPFTGKILDPKEVKRGNYLKEL